MERIPNREEEPITSKPEHLAKGFKPIMACVVTKAEDREPLTEVEEISRTGLNADYSAQPGVLEKKGFKTAGHGTYAISPIDGESKFTKDLRNCTSLVAVGKEKGTGDEISFITHQTPADFLREKKDKFSKDIIKQLSDLKKRCEEGSIDVVIAGGNIRFEYQNIIDDYVNSVKKLGEATQEALGFDPMVVSGPKEDYDDSIYFDTAERRLYVVRPGGGVDLHNETFRTGEIDRMKEKWEAENNFKK